MSLILKQFPYDFVFLIINVQFSFVADRRSVLVNMRTHIPERLLQISSETRTVLATNKDKFLKIYLYFTEPVMNSSSEILSAITINQGSLFPINGTSRGQRRFGYQVHFHLSGLAILC